MSHAAEALRTAQTASTSLRSALAAATGCVGADAAAHTAAWLRSASNTFLVQPALNVMMTYMNARRLCKHEAEAVIPPSSNLAALVQLLGRDLEVWCSVRRARRGRHLKP
ncbi:MAG: hypothetical protein EOO41_01785 [Methanobacteriota archaeon]|nr:MAG: hypothetical protein EOO41_01785 [Euryarchaeota archaeon]